MRNLYLFVNHDGNAIQYGIKTYIDNLLECLKNEQKKITIIHLYTIDDEIKIEEYPEGISHIRIPTTQFDMEYTKFQHSYLRNIAFLLKNLIPDSDQKIFHLNFMGQNQLIHWLKKLFLCKIILTIHCFNWSFYLLGNINLFEAIIRKQKTKITEAIEKKIIEEYNKDKTMMEQCDKVICVAQHSYNFIKKWYATDDNRIHLIYNSIQDNYIRASLEEKNKLRKKYYIPENEKIILFVGRLDEGKGIEYLISTFKRILQKHTNTHLFIAGDGNYHDWIPKTNSFWTKIVIIR